MLLELLVTVSGYPSSIDPGSLNHPSEQQILQRAQKFGQAVSYLSEHCFKLGGPIVEVLQKMLFRFYDLVVALEAQVYDNTLQDMCSVMAQAVDPHERLFAYCCELAASQTHLDAKIAVQLRKDRYSGFTKIADIAAESLKAIDQYYIKQMTPWLMWGVVPKIDILYPDLPECSKLVQNIGDCLRVIDTSQYHSQFLAYADFVHDLVQSLEYPLEHNHFKPMLLSIQEHLDSQLLPLLQQQLRIDDLVYILRKVFLCGSPLFCMCFVESHPIDFTTFDQAQLSSALSLYFEDTAELSSEQFSLVQEMIGICETGSPALDHEFTDLLTAANLHVEVTVHQQFQLFLSSGQGDIYGVYFYYLLSIWVINDALKKPSPSTFKLKQFLNIIWAYFQKAVHEAMDELQKMFSTISLPLIPAAHTKLLKRLGSRLLLGNQLQRMQLKLILLDATSAAQGLPIESDSIKNFIQYLSSQSEHVELSSSLACLEYAEL